MKTNLRPDKNGINLLIMRDVTVIDLDEVDSWLFAIDMLPKERNDACRQILSYGWYSVCNIDHKVEVDVKAR